MFTVYETTTTGNFRIRFVEGVGVLQCEALVRVKHPDGSASSSVTWREATPEDDGRERHGRERYSGNRLVYFQGRMRSLQAWANELRITTDSLAKRLHKGPLERALTAPKDRRFL